MNKELLRLQKENAELRKAARQMWITIRRVEKEVNYYQGVWQLPSRIVDEVYATRKLNDKWRDG